MASTSEIGSPKPRVLIVDNEELARNTFSKNLRNLGYEVKTAPGAAKARHLLKSTVFDVALLDVVLTGGPNGLYLAAWLDKVYPDLPIVLMSDKARKVMIAEAMTLGVIEFLEKPVGLRELDLALKRAIARTAPPMNKVDPNTDESERQIIKGALDRNHWKLQQSAEELGYSVSTLKRRMKRYGLRK